MSSSKSSQLLREKKEGKSSWRSLTVCLHPIFLCHEAGSGCDKGKERVPKAHIKCDCPLASKVPTLELRWLAFQRSKKGEKSEMMMSSVDKVESDRQEVAVKRKAAELEVQLRKREKMRKKTERMSMKRQEESNMLELEEDLVNCEVETTEEYGPPPAQESEREAAQVLVDALLKQR